jgi:SAM-dependent methyltransferase
VNEMATPKSQPRQLWTTGNRYDDYVGRWSRVVAREFIEWLRLPAQLRWLDVGCGTAALSETILETAAPVEIVGIDSSKEFIATARDRAQDKRARFQFGDARALPVEDDAFDVVVSGLVLNFIPDPASAIGEMRRVVRPGGTIALYVWDYAGEMQMMRYFWSAAIALDSAARSLDEGERFPICRPERLLALFRDCCIRGPECSVLNVPTVFRNFDDFWSPFLGGQGPAPTYLGTLTESRQASLREHVRARLPIEEDGSIRLTARAFAVRGIPPA